MDGLLHTGSAGDMEVLHHLSSNRNRRRAQSHCLEHIHSAGNAAVHKNGNPAVYLFQDIRQNAQGRHSIILMP